MLTLYKNIRRLREQLGYTQQELAEITGYSDRTSIAKIESGKIDLPQSKIMTFANALKTTPSDLMGWSDEDIKLAKTLAPSIKDGKSISSLNLKATSADEVANLLYAIAHFAGKEIDDIFTPEDCKIVINGIDIPFPLSEKQWLIAKQQNQLHIDTNNLNSLMHELNNEGRDKVINYAEDLITSGRYKINDTPKYTETFLNAAHERTDINIKEGADTNEDAIMDDKDF